MEALSPPTTSRATSVTSAERIQFLDVLRGLALLGILLVNLPILAAPLAQQLTVEPSGTDSLVAIAIRALAENKFMALFSLLFGMGLALQVDRAERHGRDPNSFYPKRLVLLAIFGLANGALLFFGDILFPYAIAGTALYLLRGRSERTLLVIAGVLLVIGISLSIVFEGLVVQTPDDETLEFVAGLDTRLRDGSFLSGSLARAVLYAYWLFESSLIAFNWRILALFLVGCVAMRRGWAAPEARVRFIGGWPSSRSRSAWRSRLGRSRCTVTTTPRCNAVFDVLCHQIGGLFLAAGYAGAVALWCGSRFLRAVARLVREDGPHGAHELPRPIVHRWLALLRPRPRLAGPVLRASGARLDVRDLCAPGGVQHVLARPLPRGSARALLASAHPRPRRERLNPLLPPRQWLSSLR